MAIDNSSYARELLAHSQQALQNNKQLLEDNTALIARGVQLCDELATANQNQQQCLQTIMDLQEQLRKRAPAADAQGAAAMYPFKHPVACWLASLVTDGLMEELPEHSRNAWWWTQAAVELLRCAHSAEIGGYPLEYYDGAPFEIWLDGPDKGFALTITMPLWLCLMEHTPQDAAARFTHPVARWMAALDPATLDDPLPPEQPQVFRRLVLQMAENVEIRSQGQHLYFNSGYRITVSHQGGNHSWGRTIRLPEDVRQAANSAKRSE